MTCVMPDAFFVYTLSSKINSGSIMRISLEKNPANMHVINIANFSSVAHSVAVDQVNIFT